MTTHPITSVCFLHRHLIPIKSSPHAVLFATVQLVSLVFCLTFQQIYFFLLMKLIRSPFINGEKWKSGEVWKRVHLATTSHLRNPGGEAGLLKGRHLFFIVKMQNTERTSVFLHLDLGTQHCRMQKRGLSQDSQERTQPCRRHTNPVDIWARRGIKPHDVLGSILHAPPPACPSTHLLLVSKTK